MTLDAAIPRGDGVLSETALARAQRGDENAFRELTDPYRRELHLHCYRIVGSVQDAEDLLQETLLAAWRGLGGYEGRASVRAWLYRIATNRCLNALRDSARRPREVTSMGEPPEPTRRAEPLWLEPYPDALLDGLPTEVPGPAARYETREAVGLAFVAALQQLPPRQRVVLVLRDVLGFRAAEVAETLGTTEVAVKGALQRARATLDAQAEIHDPRSVPLPSSARERDIVGRFAQAVEAGDVGAVVALLTEDAWVTMPPQPYEYQGHAAIAAFLEDRTTARSGRAMRLVPTRANGQPAFGCYVPDAQAAIAHAHGLMVLTLEGERVSAITWFGDHGVFPYFGLPRTLRS
jgi:RNA polymerase sigma-70 factor (TIGR02960 family)